MIAVHKTNMALTDNYKIHFILFLKRNVPVTFSEEQMCNIASIKPSCFLERLCYLWSGHLSRFVHAGCLSKYGLYIEVTNCY